MPTGTATSVERPRVRNRKNPANPLNAPWMMAGATTERLYSRERQRMKLSGVITAHIMRMPQPRSAP